eukprot:3505433-Prymnesium_polylepis.1
MINKGRPKGPPQGPTGDLVGRSHRSKRRLTMSSSPLFAKNDVLEGRDRCGTWLEGKVIKVKGEGDSRKLLVKFKGWGERYNEWLSADK